MPLVTITTFNSVSPAIMKKVQNLVAISLSWGDYKVNPDNVYVRAVGPDCTDEWIEIDLFKARPNDFNYQMAMEHIKEGLDEIGLIHLDSKKKSVYVKDSENKKHCY